MTGFGTAASLLGRPDVGLVTMTEMVDNARRIRLRFRHRYEVDPKFIGTLEQHGLVFSGKHPTQPIMQILELPQEVDTVGALRHHLRERGDAWAAALAPGRALRMACNQQMADEATPLSEGCEVAFFPPVTGG